jgi:hypothetical protein
MMILENLVNTLRLPMGCGLLLNRKLGTRRVHPMNEITIGTITDARQKKLIGITIDIVGVLCELDPENRTVG